MTVLTQLNLVYVPPDALMIKIPTVAELKLIQDPGLAARWIARPNYAAEGVWYDDKLGIPGMLMRNSWPAYTPGGINGQPYLQFHATNTAIIMAGEGGENLWPSSGAFTLCWVAAPTPASAASQQTIFATATSNTNALARAGYNNDGLSILVRNGSGLIVNHALTSVPTAQCVVFSYDYSDRSWVLYINGTPVASGVHLMVPTTNRLTMFGGVTPGESGVASAGFNGKFYEGLVYRTAIHKRAESLATLNAYMQSAYGLGA